MHRALILLLAFIGSAKAATWPAASASRTDVNTAVGLASAGDLVTVPAGSATWASPITLPDGVKITGNGIGSTVLTTAGSGIFIPNDNTWIEGFSMLASGGSTSDYFISPAGTNVVVKDVLFNCETISGGGGVLMAIYHQQQNMTPSGVMKSCILIDTRAVINSPYIDGQHVRWAQPTALGAEDTFYFEDCIFIYKNTGHTALDAQYGGSYVARNCTFSNCFPSMHSIQTGNGRAVRKFEIYNNNFVGSEQPNAISVTSTGVIYSNTCALTLHVSERVITISYARAYEAVGDGGKADGHSNWDGNAPLFSGTHTGGNNAAGLTDGTKSWTVNQFVISGWSRWLYNTTDGSKGQITANAATTATVTLSGGSENDFDTGDAYYITDGYIARDQPGAGKDAVTWPSPYSGQSPAQASEPIYIWDNTDFATPIVNINDQGQPQSDQLFQEGRDYILDEHPSYTPLEYPHPLLGEGGEPEPPTSGGVVISGGSITIRGNVTIRR